MAAGFGVGSALFAAGAMLSVMQADAVFTSVVYALGAVCFTTAAGVQWRSAADHHPPSRLKDPDWMSAAIQFVGTLYFNVMTIRALILSIDATSVSYDAVWQPDVVGSLLFLISSWVAWHPIAREHRHHLLHGRSLLICWANMLGSVFFGISAVARRCCPTAHCATTAGTTGARSSGRSASSSQRWHCDPRAPSDGKLRVPKPPVSRDPSPYLAPGSANAVACRAARRA